MARASPSRARLTPNRARRRSRPSARRASGSSTSTASEPRMATRGWRPEGSHVRPTWFPDGRRLFFASQRLDTTDFWTVDLESGALTRVLEAGARAVDATLTPDGRAAYYVRMDDHFDLWKLPLRRAMARPRASHNSRYRRANSTSATSPCTRAAISWPTSGWRRSPACAACRSAGTGLPAGPSVRIAEDAVRRARRPSFSPDAPAGRVRTAGGRRPARALAARPRARARCGP